MEDPLNRGRQYGKIDDRFFCIIDMYMCEDIGAPESIKLGLLLRLFYIFYMASRLMMLTLLSILTVPVSVKEYQQVQLII